MSGENQSRAVVYAVVSILLETFAIFVWYPMVMALMWNWFVVPLGAPVITHWHWVGLLVLWAWFRANRTASELSWDKIFVKVVANLIVPVFALAIGAIAHAMMGG